MSNAEFLQARVESLEKLLRDLTKDVNIATIEVLKDRLIDIGDNEVMNVAIEKSIKLTNEMYKIKELFNK